MMYPFLTLDDGTEIVHSEMHSDGTVKVYMEKPDAKAPSRSCPAARRSSARPPT